jgi:hypothetical protein
MEENEASSPLREAYATARGARGKVSNILRVHSVHPAAMTAHLGLYVELMFAPSELSRAERGGDRHRGVIVERVALLNATSRRVAPSAHW